MRKREVSTGEGGPRPGGGSVLSDCLEWQYESDPIVER